MRLDKAKTKAAKHAVPELKNENRANNKAIEAQYGIIRRDKLSEVEFD